MKVIGGEKRLKEIEPEDDVCDSCGGTGIFDLDYFCPDCCGSGKHIDRDDFFDFDYVI